ncbi:hypothetical protein PCANB_001830 [Pneumocystis canis]|nr:hypothetical protein PCANB_001830 [Pneumocystis canis]
MMMQVYACICFCFKIWGDSIFDSLEDDSFVELSDRIAYFHELSALEIIYEII